MANFIFRCCLEIYEWAQSHALSETVAGLELYEYNVIRIRIDINVTTIVCNYPLLLTYLFLFNASRTEGGCNTSPTDLALCILYFISDQDWPDFLTSSMIALLDVLRDLCLFFFPWKFQPKAC